MITDPERGEIICSSCGRVMLDRIQDVGPEWRAFTAAEANDRSRTGIPTSLARYDMGLYTIIGQTDKDARGQKLDLSIRSTMGRLRAWDFRTQAYTSADKNLQQAFNELGRLKDKLGLSDAIIEKSAYIYRKAHERGMVRGRTISGILAAALYIACRELRNPRTLKDIAIIINIKRKDIARIYKLLVIELDIKIPVVDPMNCITMIANKVNLREKTRRKAMSIMHDVTKREISAGKNPMGLAASVLYLSCLKTGEYRKQINFAEAAGVTEVTIRNICRNLKNPPLLL